MNVFEGDNLVTTDIVAEHLNISPSTVRSWVFLKKIPFVKFGVGKKSSVRFNPKVLNKWIEENSRDPKFKTDQINNSNINVPLKKASNKTIQEYNNFIKKIKQ